MKTGQKIGLLGGSFNPAHAGHKHISEIALKKLGLDQVWWLVSPQNPLKSAADMASFDQRLASADKIIGSNNKIKASDLEARFGTQYTIDTLERLQHKFPEHQFVWLMGADNLIQLPSWKYWEDILRLVPVHVFDRAEFFYKAIGNKAYIKYPSRITYHRIRKHALSATEIRKNKDLYFLKV